jgi:hypothetical protein
MNDFVSGMLTMGYLVAGIFFLRFWRDSRDRLFGMFGAAFFILALQRLGLEFITDIPEHSTVWYFIRLLAFVIIIIAIIDKNRKK